MTNWEVVNRSKQGGSMYKRYWDEMAIFVPSGKTKAFLVTPAVVQALGNAKYVLVLTNGDKVALQPSTGENSNAYAISGKSAKGGKMLRVACGKFIGDALPQYPYTVRFKAEKDGEMVVFDTTNYVRV